MPILACSSVRSAKHGHDKSHITYVTPAHPRRCLRSRCERRHLLPSAPSGAPMRPKPLSIFPCSWLLLLNPCPIPPAFSPRRYAHGGKAGRLTIARKTRNRLAFCDHGSATLRHERKTSPPLIATLLVLLQAGAGREVATHHAHFGMLLRALCQAWA